MITQATSIPMVTFIIPCFNCESTIDKAIQSALNQKSISKEVIVVDDASTQNLRKKIEQYQDSRIKYVRLKKNAGTANARNIGLRTSRGLWVQFLDADDTISFSKCCKQLKHSDSADIIISDWIRKDVTKNRQKFCRNFLSDGKANIYDFIEKNPIPVHAALVQASFIKQIGGFDTQVFHEDWEFWIRAASAKPIIKYVKGFHSIYFRHHDSKSYDLIKNFRHQVECLDYVLSRPYINSVRLKHKIHETIRNKLIRLAVEQKKAAQTIEANNTLTRLSPPLSISERLEIASAGLPLSTYFHGKFPGPKKLKRWHRIITDRFSH